MSPISIWEVRAGDDSFASKQTREWSFIGLSGNPVAGVVKQRHRLQKRLDLFFGRGQFDLQ